MKLKIIKFILNTYRYEYTKNTKFEVLSVLLVIAKF